MKEVKELRYNYTPPIMETSNGGERIDAYSEDYETAIVGENGVIRIDEHCAVGEGDKWYYDIVYKNETIKTFRPFWVKYMH